MDTLVLPVALLHETIAHMAEFPSKPLYFPVGLRENGADLAWLVRSVARVRPGDELAFSVLGERPGVDADGENLAGQVWISATNRGALGGVVLRERRRPLDEVSLVGPGMEVLALGPRPRIVTNAAADSDTERWSRTIGALGSHAAWERLRHLHVAVVGASRTASLVCAELVGGLGVRRITAVDPDRLRRHNLGEADLMTEADIGRPKAAALCGRLRTLRPDGDFVPIMAPVQEPYAVQAVKQADVIICAVDASDARLTVALIGAAHLRPCLDIGTAVLAQDAAAGRWGDSGDGATPRLRGMDVRLILPGQGCLLCQGGVTGRSDAIQRLLGIGAPRDDEPFDTHRAGSLRAWNAVAVGHGVLMLVDLVAGRLSSTTWLRVEDAGEGSTIEYPLRDATSGTREAGACACAVVGAGDSAV